MSKVIWRAGKVGITVLLFLLFLGLIFCSSKVFTPAQAEEPSPSAVQIAAEFEQAQGLVDSGKFDEAWQIYAGISEQYAMTAYDLQARVLLVKLYIAEGNVQEAEVVIEHLCADYSDHPDIVETIGDVAGAYGMRGRKAFRAIELYKYIVSTYPSHNWAIRAQARLAVCYKHKKKHAEAQAAVEKLLADYSDHPDIIKVLDDLAYRYRKEEDNEGSIKLYQYIVSTYPSHNLAMLAAKEIAVIATRAGDEQTARYYCNNIVDNYIAYPDVAREFMLIGEEYYKKALSGDSVMVAVDPNSLNDPDLYFIRTIEICEDIIEKMPTPSKEKWLAETYQMAADSYRHLEQYEKALSNFEEIVENWPDYEHAGYAQFSIGEILRELNRRGELSSSEADSLIETAYQSVLTIYPDSKCAAMAAKRLGR